MISLVIFFVLFPLSTFIFFCSFCYKERFTSDPIIIVSAATSGPILGSLCLRFLLGAFPGQSNYFYLSIITAIFIIPILYSTYKSTFSLFLRRYFYYFRNLLKTYGRSNRLIVVSACLIFLFTALQILLFPISESDALQYSTVARYIFEHRTTAFYPFRDAIETGFYAISSHPLSFYLMITLDHMIRNNPDPFIIKFLPIYYSAFIFLGLKIITQYFAKSSLKAMIAPPWFAFLLLIATPVLTKQMVSLGIDTIRLTMFLVMFLVGVRLLRGNSSKLSPGKLFISGIVLGCSVYIHSISLIFNYVTFGLLFLIFQYSNFCKSTLAAIAALRSFSIIILTSLLVGSEQYFANMLSYGLPISDKLPLFSNLLEMNFSKWRSFQQGLLNPWDITSRFLSGLTNPMFTGFSFGGSFILLVCLGLSDKVQRHFRAIHILFMPLATFYLIVLSFLLFGNYELIGAYRYLMTPLIFQTAFASFIIIIGMKKLWMNKNECDTPHFSTNKLPTFKIVISLFAFGLLLLPYFTKNLPFAVRQLAFNMQYLAVSPEPSKILESSQIHLYQLLGVLNLISTVTA